MFGLLSLRDGYYQVYAKEWGMEKRERRGIDGMQGCEVKKGTLEVGVSEVGTVGRVPVGNQPTTGAT